MPAAFLSYVRHLFNICLHFFLLPENTILIHSLNFPHTLPLSHSNSNIPSGIPPQKFSL